VERIPHAFATQCSAPLGLEVGGGSLVCRWLAKRMMQTDTP
jgi:hypothetical protein